MSYKNVHMRPENMLPGVRVLSLVHLSVGELSKLKEEDIFKWNHQLYGSTKFEDLAIILGIFKGGFSVEAASEIIGYARCWDEKRKMWRKTGRSLTLRLLRVNSSDILRDARKLMAAGLLDKKTLTTCLKTHRGKTNKPVARSVKWIGYNICKASIAKYGSVEAAAKGLDISTDDIDKWMDFDESTLPGRS